MSEEKELSIKTIFLIIAVALLIFWHAVIYFIYWGLT
jgi:cbb3-type cytochrome oxidase subunit 3